jgi:hypothetical protein
MVVVFVVRSLLLLLVTTPLLGGIGPPLDGLQDDEGGGCSVDEDGTRAKVLAEDDVDFVRAVSGDVPGVTVKINPALDDS